MRHLRVSPEESVVVEDSPTGIRAGATFSAARCRSTETLVAFPLDLARKTVQNLG